MGALYWITTNAMVTKRSGDRVNVGFAVRAPFEDVDQFINALNSGRLLSVERIETRALFNGGRELVTATPFGLSAAAVASIAPFTGTLEV